MSSPLPRRPGPRRVRRLTAIAATCLCLASTHAWAMLKCQWPDQTTNFATQPMPGARCSDAGLLEPPPHRAAASHGAPSAASEPRAATPTPAPAPASSESATATLPKPPAAPSNTRPVTRRREIQLYAYVEDGVRHYSNRKPLGVSQRIETLKLTYVETCFLCESRNIPSAGIGALSLNTTAFQHEIDTAARDFGVESALVRAVVHAESGYRPHVISRAGAQGLMQLMPATAVRFSVSDPFDAAQNIRGGVAYLAWLLKRFGGNVDLALAGFNAGENAVARYSGIPPYAETQTYVVRVKALAERYRSAP